MLEKIPKIDEPEFVERYDIVEEEFVEVSNSNKIEVRMQYPKLKMKYAIDKCLLRKGVYQRLLDAANRLPFGIKLCILDAWRPFALQKELYEKYSKEIIIKFNLEDESIEKQKCEIAKFVSEPKEDKLLAPVHTTGGSVDVTLLNQYGDEMEMGTEFDELSIKSYSDYYEGTNYNEVISNRRLLYSVMTKAGFSNLPSEWWHYDYGNKFWAYYKEKYIIYSGIFRFNDIEI